MAGWSPCLSRRSNSGYVGFLQLNWVYKSVTSDHRVEGSSPAGCKSAFRADLQAISTAAVRDELPFSSASDQRRAIPISGTPSMHYLFLETFQIKIFCNGR